MIKTEQQITDMRKAIEITDIIFSDIKNIAKPGMTELEIYNLILSMIEDSEAETYSFTPIVAAGANAAVPHHEATDYVMKDDDFLVIDMGVFYNGMASDMTRTIALGEVSEFQHEIYSIVREAMNEATKIIKDGTSVADVDIAARNFIQWSGYGDNYIHTTGHGLGKEVHEAPNVIFNSKEILREGMVITIEPGIYIENEIGVRLENDILVKKEGYEILNKSSLDY